MTEATELFQEWRANQAFRAQWYEVLRSPVWKAVTRLAEAAAISGAEHVSDAMPDVLLARRLAKQIGSRETLRFLERACDPEPAPVATEEPYGHVTEEFWTRKQSNQTEPNL